ncbi:MAG: hypothetical protein F7C33_04510 [Desulfurococcales archaeon]|nr:hypothetical protein [Desulfurococcales archaeon]
MAATLELVEARVRLQEIEKTLAQLEVRLRELEEARKLLESVKVLGVYKVYGGRIGVELPPEKAGEELEKELSSLRSTIELLRREREKLLSKIREAVSRAGF